MDRFQHSIGYETSQPSLHGRHMATEQTQDLSSQSQHPVIDPWALHLGSSPSMRHCQPMKDVYTL